MLRFHMEIAYVWSDVVNADIVFVVIIIVYIYHTE